MIHVDFAQGFNLPPYWLNHPQVVKKFEEVQSISARQIEQKYAGEALLGVPCAMPLRMKITYESEWWELPIEPVISISCKNIIVRRNVLKQDNTNTTRGSIKETWAQDDYEVNISGLFMSNENGSLPEDDIRKLRSICEARQTIDVQSELFTLFDITKIAIEDYSFPYTKGMENQMFSIKGYSDEMVKLLATER